ncbi:MAG: DUF4238 domain-containing protein [Acidimicrobiaceae bacterium]|nr:DUF4238 domain-containing protein [Acidimicrobiaceae bacterium]
MSKKRRRQAARRDDMSSGVSGVEDLAFVAALIGPGFGEVQERLATASVPVGERVKSRLEKLLAEAEREAGRDHREHHWIPQFWLREFADEGRQVGVVDPSGQTPERRCSARRAAVARDLYAIRVERASAEAVSAFWERWMGVFEHEAACLFKDLACGDGHTHPADASWRCLSDEDRLWLSMLFALQRVRTPKMIDAGIRSAVNIAQRFVDQMWPDDFTVTDDSMSVVPSLLPLAFGDAALMSFFGRSWSLVTFPDGGLCVPWDSGLLCAPGATRGPLLAGPVGVGNAEAILVPLAPNRLLLMHWEGDGYDPRDLRLPECIQRLAWEGSPLICHPRDFATVSEIGSAALNDLRRLHELRAVSEHIGQPVALMPC